MALFDKTIETLNMRICKMGKAHRCAAKTRTSLGEMAGDREVQGRDFHCLVSSPEQGCGRFRANAPSRFQHVRSAAPQGRGGDSPIKVDLLTFKPRHKREQLRGAF